MQVDAIVPAYNEAKTITQVISPLLAARRFRKVLVVDDGSKDGTAQIAAAAGANVYVMPKNGGKGGAMLTGLSLCQDADAVGFFDADLIGFRPDHAQSLVDPVVCGAADMVCGLRDYGSLNEWQQSLPPITGERVIRMPFLRAVPNDFWSGFRIEAGINAALQKYGGRVSLVVLDGLKIRLKWEKVGARKGVEDMAKMTCEVLVAMRDAERRV